MTVSFHWRASFWKSFFTSLQFWAFAYFKQFSWVRFWIWHKKGVERLILTMRTFHSLPVPSFRTCDFRRVFLCLILDLGHCWGLGRFSWFLQLDFSLILLSCHSQFYYRITSKIVQVLHRIFIADSVPCLVLMLILFFILIRSKDWIVLVKISVLVRAYFSEILNVSNFFSRTGPGICYNSIFNYQNLAIAHLQNLTNSINLEMATRRDRLEPF